MNDLVRLAALNNAEWCDAVCRARGSPGEFEASIWLNRHAAPRFYPNAVTLTPDGADQQLEAMARLGADLGAGFAVKDSFATLDLAPVGFAPLLAATWISRPPGQPAPEGDADLDWRIVSTPTAFRAWQAGWSGGEAAPSPFAPALLKDPAVTLIGGWRGADVVAGAALNRSTAALGWSNVFGPAVEIPRYRAAALRFALGLASDLPLVGYEQGVALQHSLEIGFTACGPLTVWGC